MSKTKFILEIEKAAKQKRSAKYVANDLGLRPSNFSKLLKKLGIESWKEIKKAGKLLRTKQMKKIMPPKKETKRQITRKITTETNKIARENEKKQQDDLLDSIIDEELEKNLFDKNGLVLRDEKGDELWVPDDQFNEALLHLKFAEKQNLGDKIRFPDVIKYLDATEQLKAKQQEMASDEVFFKKFTSLFDSHLDDLGIIQDGSHDANEIFPQLKEYYKGERLTTNNLA